MPLFSAYRVMLWILILLIGFAMFLATRAHLKSTIIVTSIYSAMCNMYQAIVHYTALLSCVH